MLYISPLIYMSMRVITALDTRQLGDVHRYGQQRDKWERGECGTVVVRSGGWVLMYGGGEARTASLLMEVYVEYRHHGTACACVTQ